MTNEYYDPLTESPLTAIRSSKENNDRAAVEAGFDELPTKSQLHRVQYGADVSVAAALYEITVPRIEGGAYYEGLEVTFRAVFENTGAANISVNGGLNKPVVDGTGVQITAASIKAGQVVSVLFVPDVGFQLLTTVLMASDIQAVLDAEIATAASAANAATNAANTAVEPLAAHGIMGQPVVSSDFTFPATTANEFTINASIYHINGAMVAVPQQTITLPAAPNTAGLLTRADIVYLRESGAIGVFEGTDNGTTMADAGFTAVTGEHGLWQDGTGYAVSLVLANRKRNQGLYHQYFNSFGTKKASDGFFWYNTSVEFLSTADCFDPAKLLTNSGSIASGVSGRDDGKFFDAILTSDIQNLRLSAHKPNATQLDPAHWLQKAVAADINHYAMEGTPFTKVIEREVVETGTTGTSSTFQVGNSSSYALGDFVVWLTDNGRYVASGYVRLASGDKLTIHRTMTTALSTTYDNATPRTNGDTYTIFKEVYSQPQGQENTWCDVIGAWENMPRQATGVVDWTSDQGVQTIQTGSAIELTTLSGAGTGIIGNVYIALFATASGDLGTSQYTNTANFKDLGPKATYLANAQGFEGHALLYDEEGNSLIPDGTSKDIKMSRKASEAYSRQYTNNKGVSWFSDMAWNAEVVSATNGPLVEAVAVGYVVIQHYRTKAHITTDAANLPVHGSKLSDVSGSNDDSAAYGVELTSDLIGKVAVNTTAPELLLAGSVMGHALKPDGTLDDSATSNPTHDPISLGGTGPAVKTLAYITEINQQAHLVFLFKEMIYDVTWGDNNKFDVASNTSTTLDANANTVLIGSKVTPLPFILGDD